MKTVEKIRIFFDGKLAKDFARSNNGSITNVLDNGDVVLYEVTYYVTKGRR